MGTLDPLATGVLPLAFGKATKLIEPLMNGKKAYDFRIKWGAFTTTADAEGEITTTSDRRPQKEEIEKILPKFTGKIEQMPPRFSALKINGKRACDLARAGKEVELKARVVEIFELKLLAADENGADFSCLCGKGTYIRSLAEDISKALQTAGFVEKLRRTMVEPFDLSTSYTIETLANLTQNSVYSDLENILTPLCDIKDGPYS